MDTNEASRIMDGGGGHQLAGGGVNRDSDGKNAKQKLTTNLGEYSGWKGGEKGEEGGRGLEELTKFILPGMGGGETGTRGQREGSTKRLRDGGCPRGGICLLMMDAWRRTEEVESGPVLGVDELTKCLPEIEDGFGGESGRCGGDAIKRKSVYNDLIITRPGAQSDGRLKKRQCHAMERAKIYRFAVY